MNLKKLFTRSLLVTSMAGILAACNSSDSSDSSNETTVTQPPVVAEPDPLYLVKSTDWSTDDGTTFIFLTDSLDTETVFNPEDAQLVMSGYHYAAVAETGDNPNNAFYFAVDNTPRLQRYTVSDEGEVTLAGEMNFSEHGITDARNAMRSGKIFSDDKGYFIDFETMQVIVFNPTEMTLTTVIDISEHAEEDYPRRWSVFPVVDGDRVVVPITFYESDWTPAALSKLVVVDTITDTVTVDSSDKCGSISSSAKDAAGNVYFATSHDIAVKHTVGVPGAFAPCMIRMETGADGWDDDYYVDMTSLTPNGRPAYGALTGNGDTAYTLVYSDEAEVITAENVDATARSTVWEFNSFTLGAESVDAIKVEGALPTNHRIKTGAFTNTDGDVTSWVHRINDTWTESTIYNATNPQNWEVLTVVPGDLETIARIR